MLPWHKMNTKQMRSVFISSLRLASHSRSFPIRRLETLPDPSPTAPPPRDASRTHAVRAVACVPGSRSASHILRHRAGLCSS